MKKIDELLSEYGESHQNSTNKAIHWICVPLIFLSIVGLLASIPSDGIQRLMDEPNPYANWALVALVLVLIYYVSFSIPLSIGIPEYFLCNKSSNPFGRKGHGSKSACDKQRSITF